MTVLVYVGVNRGDVLATYVNLYDEVYAFEPDPEMFSVLENNFGQHRNVTLINAACSDEEGDKTLYVTENRASSSLAELSDFSLKNGFSGGTPSFKSFDIKCINLYNYLTENNVEHVDTLITDCQGSDLAIMQTLKPYIDNKKIDEMFCETHLDGVELYDNLKNEYSGFKELLSTNYKVKDFYLDGRLVSKEVPPFVEWDTHWILK
jgi:FkbM family methyltransferase